MFLRWLIATIESARIAPGTRQIVSDMTASLIFIDLNHMQTQENGTNGGDRTLYEKALLSVHMHGDPGKRSRLGKSG
jgi:hypothetical protein